MADTMTGADRISVRPEESRVLTDEAKEEAHRAVRLGYAVIAVTICSLLVLYLTERAPSTDTRAGHAGYSQPVAR